MTTSPGNGNGNGNGTTLDLQKIRLTVAQFIVLFLMCAGTVGYAATTLATLKNVVAANDAVVARLNKLDDTSRTHEGRLDRHEVELEAIQRTLPPAQPFRRFTRNN